jgi:hypothetical protein
MPSTATLRASGKKVFAHYVPWFPLSFDNKDASVDYYTKELHRHQRRGWKVRSVRRKAAGPALHPGTHQRCQLAAS